MKRASHRMNLRSKSDSTTATSKKVSSKEPRTVLGDVSNKRNTTMQQSKVGCGGDIVKRTRSTRSVKNTENENNNVDPAKDTSTTTVTLSAAATAAASTSASSALPLSEKTNEVNNTTKNNNNKPSKRRFSLRLQKRKKDDVDEKPIDRIEERQSKKQKSTSSKRSRSESQSHHQRLETTNHQPTQKSTTSKRSRSASQSHPQIDSIVVPAQVVKKEETATTATTTTTEPFRLVHPQYKLQKTPKINFLTEGTAPHDKRDQRNELQVTNYVTDMFQNLYQAESTYRPKMYMANQRDINAKMRAILVDWLVEVHMKFRLVPETLFLCVNIIDRYCNLGPIKRSQLQLVGVTALLVACKYEEIYPPEVSDCVYITDKAYTRREVLDMEQNIVHMLRFRLSVPTAYPFLQRFLNLVNASQLIKHAASYYLERTLQEYDLNVFKPSVVSAASVILAINNPDICKRDEFNIELVSGMPEILLEYTGFQVSELCTCAKLIAAKVAEEPITASKRQLIAVKRKYENRKYMHVSAMRLPSADFSNTTNSV